MTPEGPGDRMESGLNTHAEPIPVLQFLNMANPQDEFFMVTFAERPQLVDDFTQNVESCMPNCSPRDLKGGLRC
jgi:hypothetical protein